MNTNRFYTTLVVVILLCAEAWAQCNNFQPNAGRAANFNLNNLKNQYNTESQYAYADMLGVTGLKDWDHYDPNITCVTPPPVNPMKQITQLYRSFHLMGDDFEKQFPRDVNGIPTNLQSYKNRYASIQAQGFKVQVSLESIFPCNGCSRSFPDKWYYETEWAASGNPADIRNIMKNYTVAFINEMCPSANNCVIDVLEIGNEAWGYPNPEIFKALLRGSVDACIEVYGNNTAQWPIKLYPGAFQAFRDSRKNCLTDGDIDKDNIGCQYDDIGEYLPCDVLNYLSGINIHPYSFPYGGNPDQLDLPPEDIQSEFNQIINAVAWRDANMPGKDIHITEFGWDTNNFNTDVTEAEQAAYLLRALLIQGRYEIERAFVYSSFDLSSAGTYQTSGLHTIGPVACPFGTFDIPPGGRPKKSFNAYKDFVSRFPNKRFHQALSEGDIYAYVISDENGADPYLIFWNPNEITNDNQVYQPASTAYPVTLPSGYELSTETATLINDGNGAAISLDLVQQKSCGQATLFATGMPAFIQLKTCTDNPPCSNLALNKPVSQDGTQNNQFATYAVDGNTNGVWNAMAQTDWKTNAWFEVDLQAIFDISEVKVWNIQEDNATFMKDFSVFVSEDAFISKDYNQTLNQPGVERFNFSGQAQYPTNININKKGRYVRVQLNGQAFVVLAELEVIGCSTICNIVGQFCDDGNPNTENDRYDESCTCIGDPIPPGCNSPVNVAIGKIAVQDGTQNNQLAGNAVNGSTTGVWNDLCQTDWKTNAWWEVDLNQTYDIKNINVWNIAGSNAALMNNFWVFVSPNPFNSKALETTKNQTGVQQFRVDGTAEFPSNIAVNANGRFVRVQLNGAGFVTMAEVEVFGCPPQGGASNSCNVTGQACDDDNPFTSQDEYDANCQCQGTMDTNVCNLVVSNTNNEGAGSLREAIACADDGATIRVANHLTHSTIFLSQNDILIDKNLNLQGPDGGTITLNGSALPGILTVQNGATVHIQRINFVGGTAQQANVINNEGIIYIDDSKIFNGNANPNPSLPRLSGNGTYYLSKNVDIY